MFPFAWQNATGKVFALHLVMLAHGYLLLDYSSNVEYQKEAGYGEACL